MVGVLYQFKQIVQMALFCTYSRKRVGQLASKKWGGCFPKFNNPQSRIELEEFAKEIEKEVAIPDIGFDKQGIMQHIRDFYNEQRRHNKRVSFSLHAG